MNEWKKTILILLVFMPLALRASLTINCLVSAIDALPGVPHRIAVGIIDKIIGNSPPPIKSVFNVTVDDARDVYRADLKKMHKWGIPYRDTYINNLMYRELKAKDINIAQDLRFSDWDNLKSMKLLEIKELPSVKSNKSIFHRKEFAPYFEELQKAGYKVVIDPSMPLVGTGAYVNFERKILALRPDSNWSTFMHEYQHFLFEEHISSDFKHLVKLVERGFKVEKVLDESQLKAMGPEKIKKLQTLLENGIPETAIDETLSLHDELLAIGFRKYNPFSEGMYNALGGHDYIADHVINELRNVGKWDELTHGQRVSILKALRTKMLVRVSEYGALGTAFVGGVGTAGVAAHDIFINPENGAIVEIRNGRVYHGHLSRKLRSLLYDD